MHILKTFVPILFVGLLFSCNDNKQAGKQKDQIEDSKPIGQVEVQADLTKYGIANNSKNVLGGLKVGDKAPDFIMENQDGESVSLKNTLKDGPVLLVFLRAEWCSFCVRHLQAFQDNIQAIQDAGDTKVLAVSPQEKSYMKTFHDEHQFSYPILHDADHSVMKDYKVFFHVTDKYNDYIEEAKGKRIEVFNGNEEAVMPIPATYLIGQDQIIQYVHYDPDYKKRSDVSRFLKS